MMRLAPYVAIAMTASFMILAVSHTNLKTELADVRRGHAEQLLDMAAASALDMERVTRHAESLQAQLAALDAQYTKELNDAQAKNGELRAAVDAGARRLHILTKRPTHCPAVSGTADDTSLGDGATVELAPAARRAYFNLRAGVTSDTAKLAACQDILRQITKREGDGHRRATD
ncbi:hypothetical protein GCM10022421_32160 [Oceanisphaera sediminis]|uniref:Lysis protein n=1 Tax=Oceanisphaera sediminis TaxID=981381 RepID=A0ABP7END1_9GAMM